MKKQVNVTTRLRKRQMLMVLPLLTLPFLTLAFWALGGGAGAAQVTKQTEKEKGLNLQLPDAHLKAEGSLDKMDYYERAAADSAKWKARIKDDPYFTLKASLQSDSSTDILKDSATGDRTVLTTDEHHAIKSMSTNQQTNKSAAEIKVYDKLKRINEALEDAKSPTTPNAHGKNTENKFASPLSNSQGIQGMPGNDPNVNRLESLLRSMNEPVHEPDTEMNQINAMLEKVMDIQHPERLNEKYKQQSNEQKGAVFGVTNNNTGNNGFYGEGSLSELVTANNPILKDSASFKIATTTSIEAVVHETQNIVNGATVKLRLLSDIVINGIDIPKGNFIYGTASLAGERLHIVINSIRYLQLLFPVALTLYDMDGMTGIYIPGAITRDVVKQSTDNVLQSVALNNLDPSIGTQAATAGIETAKNLISKKVKLIRVTLKAGYHVLLKDDNLKE